MGFDLRSELKSRAGEGPALWARYLNPQTARVVRSIGFDRQLGARPGLPTSTTTPVPATSTSCPGSGCSVSGRAHPTVRDTLHAVLDGELPDLVQMDTPLLAGLLAEALIERAPDLDRVYMCNSGTEAVEAALKFARCTTGRPRVLYCVARLSRPHGRVPVGQRGEGVSGRLRSPASGRARSPSATSRPCAGSWRRVTWPP